MKKVLHSSFNRFQQYAMSLLMAVGYTIFVLPVQAERLGELADVAGVRDNMLVGYGLVVGLDNTGDMTMQAPFTNQTLSNMLNQLGITMPEGANMQLRNIAAVMVTANLPPFARAGQRINVTVSSVGNASSLRGGTLLMTPLRGADGETYAVAQGSVLITGAGAQAAGSSVQVNSLVNGMIADGALVEREVPNNVAAGGNILELQFRKADFNTVRLAVEAINRDLGQVASAVDGRVLQLQAPGNANERVAFIAQVQNIEIDPGPAPARVVINSRTGSIVLTERVTLRPAAVSHGNLSITIDNRLQISQPAPFGQGSTVVAPQAAINVNAEGGVLQRVEGADLAQVVDALNALGATPQDLMAILQALKAAGSLRAELEIL